ncbi:hypothetical protein LL072_10610 [Lactobacillus delbrueckii subsp. lactis DSM 20072]|nr:stress response regulator Gls24 [Lactobacillus delbrueckii subsp. lactis DSM 20072]OOV10751.1 hypothetical protein LL072_10610 [Lactobacillus delbrueckii subsp. lactis DSM 20072]
MQNRTPSEKATTDEKSGIKGNLTFDDKVIQKIIGIALSEVDGLLTVDGGFFANVAEKLVNTSDVTSGIDVEVGKNRLQWISTLLLNTALIFLNCMTRSKMLSFGK